MPDTSATAYRDGYDAAGYDRYGYDRDGYDRNGLDIGGYHRNSYDSYRYDRNGLVCTHGPACLTCRYDRHGYDRNGYNRFGRDQDGYDRNGYDRTGYDSRGYDPYGRDRDGYSQQGRDRNGFDREGIHYATGTDRDSRGYDREGYDGHGYDRVGYDREGYSGYGFDRSGYNRDGYDRDGFDRDGNHRDTGDGYDSDGYDSDGYDRDGYNRDGYDRDGYDEEGYDSSGYDSRGWARCGCCHVDGIDDDDDDDDDAGGLLRSYSYQPRLVFRGDRSPYYGIELEVTTDRRGEACRIVERYAEGLAYCKEDGSVEGVEVVTHPMTLEWAMANFPWDMLPALRSDADATIVPQENGIHVHVSRDGFDSPAHLYRWLKLWYRNPRDIQRIARRQSSHWAGFDPDHRKAQKYHASKAGKSDYDMLSDATQASRYAAINTTNPTTLEVRVFASTLRPRRLKAALQLVAGTVEYARQLSCEAIAHRHGWEWRAFMSWAAKSGQYPELVAEDRSRNSRR